MEKRPSIRDWSLWYTIQIVCTLEVIMRIFAPLISREPGPNPFPSFQSFLLEIIKIKILFALGDLKTISYVMPLFGRKTQAIFKFCYLRVILIYCKLIKLGSFFFYLNLLHLISRTRKSFFTFINFVYIDQIRNINFIKILSTMKNTSVLKL